MKKRPRYYGIRNKRQKQIAGFIAVAMAVAMVLGAVLPVMVYR